MTNIVSTILIYMSRDHHAFPVLSTSGSLALTLALVLGLATAWPLRAQRAIPLANADGSSLQAGEHIEVEEVEVEGRFVAPREIRRGAGKFLLILRGGRRDLYPPRTVLQSTGETGGPAAIYLGGKDSAHLGNRTSALVDFPPGTYIISAVETGKELCKIILQ